MSGSIRVRGAETRYDNDFGGNHIERLRAKNQQPSWGFSSNPSRVCTKCQTRKPLKGGRGIYIRDGFVCADCRPKKAAAPSSTEAA